MQYLAILSALVCCSLAEAKAFASLGYNDGLYSRSTAWDGLPPPTLRLIRRARPVGSNKPGSPTGSHSPGSQLQGSGVASPSAMRPGQIPRAGSSRASSPATSPGPARSRAGPSSAALSRSGGFSEPEKQDANVHVSMQGPGKIHAKTFERVHDNPFKFEKMTKSDITRVPEGEEVHKEYSSDHRLQVDVKNKPGGSHQVTAQGAFANMKSKTSASDQSTAHTQSYSEVHGKKKDQAVDGGTSYVKTWSKRPDGAGAIASASVEGKGDTKVNVDNRIRQDTPDPEAPPKLPSNHPMSPARWGE